MASWELAAASSPVPADAVSRRIQFSPGSEAAVGEHLLGEASSPGHRPAHWHGNGAETAVQEQLRGGELAGMAPSIGMLPTQTVLAVQRWAVQASALSHLRFSFDAPAADNAACRCSLAGSFCRTPAGLMMELACARLPARPIATIACPAAHISAAPGRTMLKRRWAALVIHDGGHMSLLYYSDAYRPKGLVPLVPGAFSVRRRGTKKVCVWGMGGARLNWSNVSQVAEPRPIRRRKYMYP